MNSTYKNYGIVFVIFEFHSFDLQASVADDPIVTFRLFRLCTLFLKLGSHYFGESPAPAGGGSTKVFIGKYGMNKNIIDKYLYKSKIYSKDFFLKETNHSPC